MGTPAQDLRRALAVNSTATSFASKIPTVTKPFADGLIAVANGEDTLDLFPFGAGADDITFDIRVTGWRRTVPSSSEYRIGVGAKSAFLDSNGANAGVLWLPTPIVEASCVCSAIIGIAGAVAINTDRFVDAITITKGVGVAPTVTADSGAAMLKCDVTGFALIEVTFDSTGSTNSNALYALYADGRA